METKYGIGRESVIKEMIAFCQKKIHNIEKHTKTDRKEIISHRTGLIKAYKDVIVRLNVKLNRMEAKVKNN